MKGGTEVGQSRIAAHIRRLVKAEGIPGLAIAVTDRDRTLWVGTFGFSELESRTRVTLRTLFEIGSISKFFSSLVLMQLRDEGLVDLAKPVTTYLPWFKVKSRFAPITLHHLLTHTAGLVIGQEESPEGVPEVWALRGTDTSTPPGRHFYYSNHGYKTVGLVMERLTGEPCGKLVTDRVLKPLGMDSTAAVMTNDVRTRLAVGYSPYMDDRPHIPGGPLAPATWFESGTADGTICSTPEDMCAYLRMLLNGGSGPGGRLVSKEGFALMTSPHIRPDDAARGEKYGYGMCVGKIDGHPCLWHTGGMVGFHSSIVADKEAGIGIVTMINGPGAPEDVSLYALRVARASLRGRKLPVEPPVARIAAVRQPSRYSGSYYAGEKMLSVEAGGNALWLTRTGERHRLVPLGSDRFYALGSGDLFAYGFVRRGGRTVEVHHGNEWFAGARYRGPLEFPVKKAWDGFVGHYRCHSPWSSNFRVVLRKGELVIVSPHGEEDRLVPLRDGSFRVGKDPRNPERIRFGMIVDGHAYLAVLSAGRYYRTFTP